jgi:hypothetical protein
VKALGGFFVGPKDQCSGGELLTQTGTNRVHGSTSKA